MKSIFKIYRKKNINYQINSDPVATEVMLNLCTYNKIWSWFQTNGKANHDNIVVGLSPVHIFYSKNLRDCFFICSTVITVIIFSFNSAAGPPE